MIAPGKAEKKAARAARLSAALRENLQAPQGADARPRQATISRDAPPPKRPPRRLELLTFAAIGAATRSVTPKSLPRT